MQPLPDATPGARDGLFEQALRPIRSGPTNSPAFCSILITGLACPICSTSQPCIRCGGGPDTKCRFRIGAAFPSR